jgi:S1-C subfamily serine protease
MSDNLTPEERDRPTPASEERPPQRTAAPASPGMARAMLWVLVGLLTLLALVSGGIGGFLLGRSYEQNRIDEDYLYWLLGGYFYDDGTDVYLSDMVVNGPVHNAGVDVYVEARVDRIDGERVTSAAEARALLKGYGPGDTVVFSIEQSRFLNTYYVTLGYYGAILVEPVPPPIITVTPVMPIPGQSYASRLGVTYRMLLPEDNFAVSEGALMVTVGNPAASEGLQIGDIIIAIENTKLDQANTLEAVLDRFSAGSQVKLIVDRAGEQITVPVVLASD